MTTQPLSALTMLLSRHTRRREFITLLGGAAAAWPLAARAQPAERVRRIGVLLGSAESDPQGKTGLAAFEKALRELGWQDGRNVRIDYRWTAADFDRMRTLAKELVNLRPDVIVASTTPVLAVLQRETTTIPIVFVLVSDPVGSGFVASLPHPGGNITGFINIESSLAGKWVELLKEVVPNLTRAAIIFNPDTAPHADYYLSPFEIAARSYGVEPITAHVRSTDEIEVVVKHLSEQPDSGLVVMPDIFTAVQRNLNPIVSLVARYRVPTVYGFRFFVTAGGLLSYGVDTVDLYRGASAYVDRIFKGAKPADLPVQLPVKFELAINLKTARALGLDLPPSLLARADEVIE
jgi:putative ABC transport system substrate-binding protein